MATADTDIVLVVPRGCYGRIAPASDLSGEGIFSSGSVVDCDYRGGVRLDLFNTKDTPHDILRGSVVAQVIFERLAYPELLELHRGVVRQANGN